MFGNSKKIGSNPIMPREISKARIASSGLTHPLQEFGAVPLARETLDEVLRGYRRPGDKLSEWLRQGALQPLQRGLHVMSASPPLPGKLTPLHPDHFSTRGLDGAEQCGVTARLSGLM
jgi:hypothetical protein